MTPRRDDFAAGLVHGDRRGHRAYDSDHRACRKRPQGKGEMGRRAWRSEQGPGRLGGREGLPLPNGTPREGTRLINVNG